MNTQRWIPLVAVAVATLASVARAQEGAAKVATCNVGLVLEQMEERKAFDLEMSQRNERFRIDGLRKQQEIKDKQGEIAGYQPGSDLYKEKNEQLMKMLIDAEFFMKFKQVENARWEKTRWAEMYDHIKQAVKEVATEKQIDLVLMERSISAQSQERLTPDEFKAALVQNEVLYAGPKVDLTSQVALKVNARYKSAASAK